MTALKRIIAHPLLWGPLGRATLGGALWQVRPLSRDTGVAAAQQSPPPTSQRDGHLGYER